MLPVAYVFTTFTKPVQSFQPTIPPTGADKEAEITVDEYELVAYPPDLPCKPPIPAPVPVTAPLTEIEPAAKDCVTVPWFTNPASPPTYTEPDPVETSAALAELPVIVPQSRLPTMPPTFAAPVIDPPDTWTFVYVAAPYPAKPPIHPLASVDVTEGLTRVRSLM
jgi:hypothetical protein